MLCTRHISGGRISTKFAQGRSTAPRSLDDYTDRLFAIEMFPLKENEKNIPWDSLNTYRMSQKRVLSGF